MAVFKYQAKALNGKLFTGEMEAIDDSQVRTKLRSQQLIPIKISVLQKQAVAKSNEGAKDTFSSLFASRPSGKDIKIFTRQFATLLNAGIPIVDALAILSNGLRQGILKESIAQVKLSIENGKRLAESMAKHPLVFDRFYVNMVRAGEEAGILDSILSRLAIYIEKTEKLKAQIKGALWYPTAIITVAMAVIAGILVFIIPKFQVMYTSSARELPAITQMVVNLSQTVTEKWYFILAALVLSPFLFLAYYRSPEGQRFFDRLFLNLPLFGEVIQKSSMAKLSRTLSTLLGSGVGMIEAIEIASRTAGNYVIEESLQKCKESVVSGKPLAQPLSKEKVFPDMVVQMIAIGEQSGTLDSMLSKIADFYEDEVDVAVKALTSMIEPLLMVVLGGIIAFLMIAMYMPIFGMADVAGG